MLLPSRLSWRAAVGAALLLSSFSALARPPLFLVDDASVVALRARVAVPGSTHQEAFQALQARVDANQIAGVTSYERGYLAREAAFAYLLTETPAYAQLAYDRLAEIYTISVPAGEAAPDTGSGLGRAQTIASFALAYNWAYAGWTEAQRAWVLDKVNRGLDQYRSDALSHPNIGYQTNHSNWNGVVAGAHIMTLLAVDQVAVRRRDYQDSRLIVRTHLESLGDRGWSQEGNFYLGLSMEYVLPAALALRQAGDPFFERALASRRLHHLVMYSSMFNAAQQSVTWGVGGDKLPDAGITSSLLGLVPRGELPYYRWFYDRLRGRLNPAPLASRYDAHAGGTIYALLGYPEDTPALDPSSVYPTVLRDSAGGYLLRSGWQDEDDTVVSLWADTLEYGRAWDQVEATTINILSHGVKWGAGPGPATSGLDTAFSQVLINGQARSAGGTGSLLGHWVSPTGGYAMVSGGTKFNQLEIDQLHRHVLADFSPADFAIVSTLDVIRDGQTNNYAWNFFLPGTTITTGLESGVSTFLATTGDAYLKAWFITPGQSFATGPTHVQRLFEAANLDLWVVMAVGTGTPPAAVVAGQGLGATVTLGDSTLTYDATTGRLQSSTLADLHSPVSPDATFTPATGGAPLVVNYHASGATDAGEVLAATWDFGDGAIAGSAQGSHRYDATGSYLASVLVDDGRGGADWLNRHAFVGNQEPTARIVAGASVVLPGVPVSLDGSTSSDPEGLPLTYTWSLGDGRTLAGPAHEVSWPVEGTYAVDLSVTDAGGRAHLARVNVRVENLAPTANFTMSVLGGFVPFAATFNASASSDPEGDPLTYHWTFGDGATAITATPITTHTYTTVGDRTVRLRVVDSAGKSDDVTRLLRALGPADLRPALPDPGPVVQGLSYRVYAGDPVAERNLPDISTLRPLHNGRVSDVDLAVATRSSFYVLTFDGYLFVPETGAYALRLRNASQSRVWIGGQLAVGSTFPFSGTYESLVALEAGHHLYRVETTHSDDGEDGTRWARLHLTWVPPGEATYRPIPDALLTSPVALFAASFTASPTEIHHGGTVQFEATTQSPNGSALSYFWDFGDGSTSTSRSVRHPYNLPSNETHRVYPARLTVTDASGATETVGQRIIVSRHPGLVMEPQERIRTQDYTIDQRTVARDLTLAVNHVREPGTVLSYSSELRADLGALNLIDGAHQTRWVSVNPEEWVRFDFRKDGAPKRYRITEYAFTAGGLPWTANRDPRDWEIYASNHPEPYSLAPGAANSAWTLIHQVTGQSGQGRIIPTVYTLPNTQAWSSYLFRLRNQSGGISGSVELTEIQLLSYFDHDPTLDGNLPPQPAFSASATTGEGPLSVSFDASATSDANGDWLYYAWSFGDGHLEPRQLGLASVTHTFQQPGTYEVSLTVTDGAGASNQASRFVTVSPPSPNASPVPTFALASAEVPAGAEVAFDGSETFDPDGDALNYRWEFGDGSAADGPVATYTYRKPGVYEPVLIVRDARGRAQSVARTLTVLPPNGGRPILSFNGDNNTRYLPFHRGAGALPVGYWNNLYNGLNPAWYDSTGQPVPVTVERTGRQDSYFANPPITDRLHGDHALGEVSKGKVIWGADEGFSYRVGQIPYAVYDVYIYYGGAASAVAQPVRVNGNTLYALKNGHGFTGSWRRSEAETAAAAVPGHDLLIWSGLTASEVVIELPNRNSSAIAGFQIVDRTGAIDEPVNTAPVITLLRPAGGAADIPTGTGAWLVTSVTDDNLPDGSLSLQWQALGGPGTVTFTDPSSATTGAQFSAEGSYVLRLTASDGQLSTSRMVSLDVRSDFGDLPPPIAPLLVNDPFDWGPSNLTNTQWPAGTGWSTGTNQVSYRGALAPVWPTGGPNPYETFGNASSGHLRTNVSAHPRGVQRAFAAASGERWVSFLVYLESGWSDEDKTAVFSLGQAAYSNGVIRGQGLGFHRDSSGLRLVALNGANVVASATATTPLQQWRLILAKTTVSASGPDRVAVWSFGAGDTFGATEGSLGEPAVSYTGFDWGSGYTNLWIGVSRPNGGSSGVFLFDELRVSGGEGDDGLRQVLAASLPASPIGAAITLSPPASVAPGVSTRLAATTTDPDGGPQPLAFAWNAASGPAPVDFATAADLSPWALFPTVGDFVVRLVADDGAVATFADAAIAVRTGGSGTEDFNAWMAAFAQSIPPDQRGPAADFSRDGLPNLLAYAFGLDPRLPVPPAERSRLTLRPDAASRWVDLRLPAALLRSHLLFAVQVSDDLGSWQTVASAVGTADFTGHGATTVNRDSDTVRIDLGPPAPAGRFVRLAVELRP